MAPAAPRLIDRGDLVAALDRAATSKVTVISAPAGSGKTSLLRATAAAALERNGIRPLLAAMGADARGLVRSLLADGAEVYNNTSQTL